MNANSMKVYIAIDKLVSQLPKKISTIGTNGIVYSDYINNSDIEWKTRSKATETVIDLQSHFEDDPRLNIAGDMGDRYKLKIDGYVNMIECVRAIYEYAVNHKLSHNVNNYYLPDIFEKEGLTTDYVERMMELTK